MRTITRICLLGLLVALTLFGGWAARARPSSQGGQPITVGNAAAVKQAALLEGHAGPVFSVAFSPDGKLLASASIDKTVRLWDVAGAKQSALLEGHSAQAVLVGFSADGATLLSAGYDKSIRLWDVKAGKQIEAQAGDPNAGSPPPDISNLYNAFSLDGTLLAYNIDGDTSLYVWDVKTKAQHSLRMDETHDHTYGPVAFSADGKLLASPAANQKDSSGNSIVLWDAGQIRSSDPQADAVKATKVLTGPPDAYYGNAIAVSADGTLLAVVNTTDTTIQIFDLKTGTVQTTLKGQAAGSNTGDIDIYGLAFSPDGSLLASASHDKTVRLWDVKVGKELVALAAHGGVDTVVFSPDGTLIASANLDGTLQLWRAG